MAKLMMLHSLHTKPDKLAISKHEVETMVPAVVWEKHVKEYDGDLHKFEKVMASSPKYSVQYAQHTRKRFKLGEPTILKSPAWAFAYMQYVIKGPWPEAESVFAKDGEVAFKYAEETNKPFKLGEPAIAKSAQYAYKYARLILHKPWPEGEPAIAKDPVWGAYYALNVLKKPWPEAEKAIDTLRNSGHTMRNGPDFADLWELYQKLRSKSGLKEQAAANPFVSLIASLDLKLDQLMGARNGPTPLVLGSLDQQLSSISKLVASAQGWVVPEPKLRSHLHKAIPVVIKLIDQAGEAVGRGDITKAIDLVNDARNELKRRSGLVIQKSPIETERAFR